MWSGRRLCLYRDIRLDNGHGGWGQPPSKGTRRLRLEFGGKGPPAEPRRPYQGA